MVWQTSISYLGTSQDFWTKGPSQNDIYIIPPISQEMEAAYNWYKQAIQSITQYPGRHVPYNQHQIIFCKIQNIWIWFTIGIQYKMNNKLFQIIWNNCHKDRILANESLPRQAMLCCAPKICKFTLWWTFLGRECLLIPPRSGVNSIQCFPI